MKSARLSIEEAIAICESWFDYLKRQEERSREVQRLATLARTDPEEARKQLRRLDTSSVTVYDGATLEPAVRRLVEFARRKVVDRADQTTCPHPATTYWDGAHSVCISCGKLMDARL